MLEPKPFLATTAYQSEMLNGAATAEAQLSPTKGLVCTMANYAAARNQVVQRTMTAPAKEQSSTLRGSLGGSDRPATAITPSGEAVGYQTTYGDMGRTAVLSESVRRSMIPTRRGPPPPAEQRYQTMPRAMPPGMFGERPSYQMDFGTDGSDPMERSAPGEKFQSRLSSTRDLCEGTTRNTNNPPGYTGHLPASKYHQLARAQADAADERMDAKIDMSLYALDQFSRSRLPGYTGFKPKAPNNITLVQPAQGPPTVTTYGAANFQSTKNGVPPVDSEHHNNR